MFEKQIKLNSIQKVIAFNKEVQSIQADIDIRFGRIEIDAKSIMGLFALDLSKPILMLSNTSDFKTIEILSSVAKKYQ